MATALSNVLPPVSPIKVPKHEADAASSCYSRTGSVFLAKQGPPADLHSDELAFLVLFDELCDVVNETHAASHEMTEFVALASRILKAGEVEEDPSGTVYPPPPDLIEWAAAVVANNGIYNQRANGARMPPPDSLRTTPFSLLIPIKPEPWPERFVVENNPGASGSRLYPPALYDATTCPFTGFALNAGYTDEGEFVQQLTTTNSAAMRKIHDLVLQLAHLAAGSSCFSEHSVNALNRFMVFLQPPPDDPQEPEDHARRWEDFMEEWAQTNDRIDWCIGPIETYHDPFGAIGEWGAQAGVAEDMSMWTPRLHAMEGSLPYGDIHRTAAARSKPFSIALVNKLTSGGANGPLYSIAAFCLPNEDSLRAAGCSKQVIHKPPPPLASPDRAALVRPGPFRRCSTAFMTALWDIHVLLHETVGHGAGSLADGVSDTDVRAAFAGDYAFLEELRADAAALHLCLTHAKELFEWFDVSSEDLAPFGGDPREAILAFVAHGAFKRMGAQPDRDTPKVTGAHAMSEMAIANYLYTAGVYAVDQDLSQESDTFAKAFGVETVPRVHFLSVVSVDKGVAAARELCELVNHTKATMDMAALERLKRHSQGCDTPLSTLLVEVKEQARTKRRLLHDGCETPLTVITYDAKGPAGYRPA